MLSPSKRYGAPSSDRVVPVRRTNPEALTANVGAAVGVGVGATVGLGVAVAAGVSVGVGVAVAAGVSVGVGVAVAAGVSVGVGVAVAAGVSVGVGVAVAPGVGEDVTFVVTVKVTLASRDIETFGLCGPFTAIAAKVWLPAEALRGTVIRTPNAPLALTVAEGIPAVEPSHSSWTFDLLGK